MINISNTLPEGNANKIKMPINYGITPIEKIHYLKAIKEETLKTKEEYNNKNGSSVASIDTPLEPAAEYVPQRRLLNKGIYNKEGKTNDMFY